jgi:hypothetical protein
VRWRRLVAAVAALALPRLGARAQGLTATDSADEERFRRVVQAVAAAGYENPVIAGRGTGPTALFFALTATSRSRADSGVLLVMAEAPGTAHPIILERARTPADLAVYGIMFKSFPGFRDLYDVEVTHHPYRVEMSYAYSTHHLFRRTGNALTAACDFPGTSSSSFAKGLGSHTSSRQVRVESVAGRQAQFLVRVNWRTSERDRPESAPVVQTADSVFRYQLDATGACHEIKSR